MLQYGARGGKKNCTFLSYGRKKLSPDMESRCEIVK
jgi:hypothetical protein